MNMKYEITGEQHKAVPIVLPPGGLSGWISWKPHSEILSKDHKVIRVQLLNMSAAEKNEAPPEGYSLRMETEALRGVLDELGIRKVHLVGRPHGGEVSLDLTLNYPNYVETLTLIEPAAYWVARSKGLYLSEEESLRKMLGELHDPVSQEDLIRFLKMNGLVPHGVDPKSLPQWQTWDSLRIALKSLHTVLDHSDEVEKLRRLKGIPILLIKGRDSTGFNSGIIDILSDLIGPDAKVMILPDGHACHIVARDKFISELKVHISS